MHIFINLSAFRRRKTTSKARSKKQERTELFTVYNFILILNNTFSLSAVRSLRDVTYFSSKCSAHARSARPPIEITQNYSIVATALALDINSIGGAEICNGKHSFINAEIFYKRRVGGTAFSATRQIQIFGVQAALVTTWIIHRIISLHAVATT